MKVSIITVVYNSVDTISHCINSILSQTYKNIEYIIIDGASTDGTIDIINKYGRDIDKFISEPDNGIYDAMNKGLEMATGDIVGILNSDDFYIDESVIENVVRGIAMHDVDSLYGDLIYVDYEHTDKIIRYWKASKFEPGSFRKGWHPPHPSFFVKKEIYDKYGYFDLEFEVSADFEIMLRFLEKYRISTSYLPMPFVKMRMGGVSNNSIKNIVIGNLNCYKAFKKNSIKITPFYFINRLAPKLKQFFIKR